MRTVTTLAAALLLPLNAVAFGAPIAAQTPPAPRPASPSPTEIVARAPHTDWITIAPADLLVMELAPDAAGAARRVVIQLLPAPFSQGWIGNIRKLAASHWWDGLSINRVQDNYVVQWGDAEADDTAKVRKLPDGLALVGQSEYSVLAAADSVVQDPHSGLLYAKGLRADQDAYAITQFWHGWPLGRSAYIGPDQLNWPVHCYGMVGVGRDMPPDTGTGAELYTVIGHAPRHLDRNIALVGRVIEGIEQLSSLPRGHGDLGFYDPAKGDKRVPIQSVRLGTEIADLPQYQFLSTESASFAAYADARANRRDAFFIHPAGGADICNVPVPVRRAK